MRDAARQGDVQAAPLQLAQLCFNHIIWFSASVPPDQS